jgi:hypothetical protein
MEFSLALALEFIIALRFPPSRGGKNTLNTFFDIHLRAVRLILSLQRKENTLDYFLPDPFI